MRSIVGCLVLLCVCRATALAQDDAPFTSEQKKEIEVWVTELKKWPLPSAHKACEFLLTKGSVVTPFLLLALKEGEPPLRAGAAYCLGKLRDKDAFPPLAEAARDRKMLPHLATMFPAMVQTDRQQAYPVLLEFLQNPNQTGKYPAFQALSAITTNEHLPLLEPLLHAKAADTRKYAVELLGKIDNEDALTLLLKSLGDASPLVAYHASTILGYKDSQPVRKSLLELVTATDPRLRGYGILALLGQEEKTDRPVFTDVWIPTLLSALRHQDYFVRGTAAAALVNVGFITENKEITEVMDKELAPVLIEVIAGKQFFRDYMSLRPTAYSKLVQLTGKDFGSDIKGWWGWWHSNNNRFRAIRLLKGISLEEVGEMALEYRSEGGMENQHFLLLASSGKAKLFPKKADRLTVILDYEQTTGMLNLLQKVRLWELEKLYGTERPNTNVHTLELTLKNRVKKITVYGQSGGVIAPVTAEIVRLAQENSWQMYWDSSEYQDWEKWYDQEAAWFQSNKDPALRDKHLKQMIIKAYGWLPVEVRDKAAGELWELMQKDSYLSKGSIELAIMHIQAESETAKRGELLVRCVSQTKESFAITALVDILRRRYSLSMRKRIELLLANAEKSLLLQYIKHSDPHLRSIAAEMLGKRPAEETVILYLIGMLQDERHEVKQSVVSALGQLRAKIAWEPVVKMVNDRKELAEVRQCAILALTQIDKEAALSTLLERLKENEPGIRMAATQAIAEIGDNASVQTLLALLRGDPAREIRQMAAHSLVVLKEKPGVVDSLLKIASSRHDLDSRILALQSLADIGSAQTSLPLSKLLEDPQEEIRIHAALACSVFYDTKAIPVLIAALGNRLYNQPIRKELEKITLKSFSERDDLAAQACYEEWWRNYGQLSPRQWFFDGLAAKGYEVDTLLDYLLGAPANMAIPVLLQALQDRDWFIRAAAVRVLEECTGKSFGKLDAYSGKQTAQKIRDDWNDWYRQQEKK